MSQRFHGLSVLVIGLLAGTVRGNITIETVPVGDPGNAADPRYASPPFGGSGSVGYTYNIGKFEVTAGQYAEFLNAVAKTDPYALYNANMASTIDGSGISRVGDSGSYIYSADAAFVNRPVNYVSFWDACRFTNWLHNGQGSGDTETGAYTLTATGIADNTVTRNANAKWAVTNQDEWYKAAYYVGGSTNAGYSDYPMGTYYPNLPGRDLNDVSGNNANYYRFTPYPIQSPFYTTVVGQFTNSASDYGTFDQGGNVSEWTEYMYNDPPVDALRGLVGGSFKDDRLYLDAGANAGTAEAVLEANYTGFRVVQLPEPATIVMLALAGVVDMRRRGGRIVTGTGRGDFSQNNLKCGLIKA